MRSRNHVVTMDRDAKVAPLGWRELSAGKRLRDGLCTRRHAQPPLRTLYVSMSRVFADMKQPTNRPIIFALGDQRKALALAATEDRPSTRRVSRTATRRVIEIGRHESDSEVACRIDGPCIRHH